MRTIAQAERELPTRDAEREGIRVAGRRMAVFAATWSVSSLAWSTVLLFAEGLRPTVVVAALAAQAVVLSVMRLATARVTTARGALRVAAGATIALGWIVLALFAAGGGSRDVLGVMLLTLYVVPAFAFGWGWRFELALETVTLLPAAGLFEFFAPSTRPAELAVAVGLGSTIALAVAEAAARNLRAAERHRLAAERRTRELVASRDAYRDLAENVQDLIWSFDAQGRWTYVNAATERFFGKPRSEILGKPITDFVVDGVGNPTVEDGLARVAAGVPARPLPILCLTTAGPRWVEALPSGIFGPDGKPIGLRGVSRDITERVASDVRRSESEAKFRMVAEVMSTPVFLFHGTCLRYVNAAAIRMVGYSEEELYAVPFWEILHPDDRAIARERGMARQHGECFPPSLEYRILTKHGETRYVEFTATTTEFEGSPAIVGTAVDVTERKRAEAARQASLDELRRSEERLRRLARHQVTIREDERRRLGFDLHDGVCQELIGAGILVHSIRERLAASDTASAAVLDRAVGYVHGVVEHLRLLARELRPMLLHDLGLADSLASLASAMTSAERRVDARLLTPIPRLSDEVELAVYRIAQEALSNAVRHADAREIVVTIARGDGQLCLEVSDDGRGFDAADRNGDELGLTGMRERAAALGGWLAVDSAVGRGTTVRLRFPLELSDPD